MLPVTSLDYLYEQAAQVDVLLRAKVQELAQASHGCFPTVSTLGGGSILSVEMYCDARREEEGAAQMVWAGLKPPARAVEKLMRCYDCDPSRLLDCCRL